MLLKESIMVAHPSTWEARQGEGCEFEASVRGTMKSSLSPQRLSLKGSYCEGAVSTVVLFVGVGTLRKWILVQKVRLLRPSP